ncbi:MAG: recombinase family protein [Clostridiales bacterium]|nr:recombinase family protein [Clostridiales bacterium]
MARDFNAEGIQTPNGSKWYGTSFHSILKHRAYIGEVEYMGEVYPGEHDPIIDRETFDAAQDRLRDRKLNDERYLHFSQKSSFLTGLCYCEHCKARKTIITDPQSRKFVTCRDKKKKQCPDERIPLEIAEDRVLEEIKKLRLDPEYLRANRKNSPNTATKEKIRILEERIADNDKKMKRLTDLYLVDGIDLNMIREKVDQITRENESSRERIQRLKKLLKEERPDEEIVDLAAEIEDTDEETVKIIVGALIERITFSGGTMVIQWRF